MQKIGITGNIASGKSEVEKILLELNYKVFDLDKLSHEVLENECKDEILNQFKTTERKKIGKIVFRDKEEKEKLEHIIHPVLKKKIALIFDKYKDEPAVFISGALIFQSGFDKLFDKIIYVDADKNLRIERLIKRNSYNREDVLLRINSQTQEGKYKSDFIVKNNFDIKKLKSSVIEVIKALKLP